MIAALAHVAPGLHSRKRGRLLTSRRLQRRVAASNVELLRLHPDHRRSWALFPYAQDRIRDFFHKYSAEGDAELICTNMRTLFVQHPQTLGLWVAYSPTVGIVGHLLAYHEQNERLGLKWTFVLQYEMDIPVPSVSKKGIDALTKWAADNGSKYIELWSPLPERFWRRYGFALHRHVMRRSV